MGNDYQNLLNLIQNRRSIRQFCPDPVERQDVRRLLEAARWAPSAGNRQAFRFVLVESGEIRTQMGLAVEQAAERLKENVRRDRAGDVSAYLENFVHFARAPLVIVPLYRQDIDLIRATQEGTDPSTSASLPGTEALASVSAAIMSLLLAAQALGLGGCWMTGPLIAAGELEQILGVPRGWQIAALVPVGRPASTPEPPKRRPLDRLIRNVPKGEQGEAQ